MANQQHEDFGEKIGGAKKDLWKLRGLLVTDLDDMNEREAEKYVTKDAVWKKPDYQAMMDDGIPIGVVYFIKKVRDSLATSPQYRRGDDTPELRLARQKQYIETLHQLQSMTEVVRTMEDAMQLYNRFLVDNGYIAKQPDSPYLLFTQKAQDNPVITTNLTQTLLIRSPEQFMRNFVQKAQKEQFGISPEQKIPRGYDIRFNDGKYTYSAHNDWQPNTYYVVKGNRILQTNFATREAALQWVQDFVKEQNKNKSSNGTYKMRFVPPQLEHIRRTGPDYRNGQDIIGEHYLETFGFRGGEFGNWLNQNDRQASLNMGFEALKDLAAALHISDKDIAFQGILAIAFGARGNSNASAHYEPLRQVINLTKLHGASSLAHEWWHGLDDYLGTKFGAKNFLSEQPYRYPPLQKLMETIKYKHQAETPEQAMARSEKQFARIRNEAVSRLDAAVLFGLQRKDDEQILNQYAQLKEAFLSSEKGSAEKINTLNKTVTGRVIPKNEREQLITYEHLLYSMQEKEQSGILPEPKRIETDYYTHSEKMGKHYSKNGDYWNSPVELTARTFACYVIDKLPYTSDYLVGHAESAYAPITKKDGTTEMIYAYPRGEERQAINAAFDELIADLKLQHIFTHTEHIQPLPLASIPLEITSAITETAIMPEILTARIGTSIITEMPKPSASIREETAKTSEAVSLATEKPEQLSLFQNGESKLSIKEQIAAAKQQITDNRTKDISDNKPQEIPKSKEQQER